MSICCTECFDEKFLSEAIAQVGTRADCPYCESTNVLCAPLKIIGHMIREGVARAYREAGDEAGPHDSEDDVYVWGDPRNAPTMLEILRDTESIFSDALAGAEDRLLDDLLDASAPVLRRQKDYLDHDLLGDSGALLYPRDGFLGAQETLFASSWTAFKYRVQHVARFFDGPGLGAPRTALLQRVQRHLTKLEVVLPAGTRLFRVRPISDEQQLPRDPSDQARDVGPAPARRSKGNRMSPPGISYTYLCFDPETALDEVRNRGATRYWMGTFVTCKALTIVDLSFTSGRKPQSIFDPKYDHPYRLLAPTLRDFADEISRPIDGSDEALDYVPTQVLTEFLGSNGADGVQYRSSRRAKGINLTLFCGRALEHDAVAPDLDPGAPDSWRTGFTPFTEWLELTDAHELS